MLVFADTVEMDASEVFEKIEEVKKIDSGAVQQFLQDKVPEVIAFGIQVVVAIIVYILGVQIIKLFRKILKKTLTRRNTDVGAVQFLDALIKYIGYFVLIMIVLSCFGVATTSVVALLGTAGLTVGLALQGSLSNFAGGVLILLLRPFRVGDYIIEDTNKNEGTVHEISVFYTKLITFDNKVVVIPNGTLANSSLTNVSQMEKRRLDLVVGISYSSDMKKAKDILLRIATKDVGVLSQEPVDVFVDSLGESGVNMGIHVWVATSDYWEVKWRLLEEVKTQFDGNGIEIPYPQVDVTMKNQL